MTTPTAQPPGKREPDAPTDRAGYYFVIVLAAAIAWLFYGFSGERSGMFMGVSGAILLALLVPIVRRRKPKP